MSHPKLPAPLTKTLHCPLKNVLAFGHGGHKHRLRYKFFAGKKRRVRSWAMSTGGLVYTVVSVFPVFCLRCPVQGHRSLAVLYW